jgi:hypothetical protein
MKPSDELIQKQTEAGTPPSTTEGEAYRLVFDALRKEPGFHLPSNFASKVAAKAMAENKYNWDKFFLISGCVATAAAFVYALISIQASFSVGIFQFVSSYYGLAVFGVAFVLLLQWIDRRLVRRVHS